MDKAQFKESLDELIETAREQQVSLVDISVALDDALVLIQAEIVRAEGGAPPQPRVPRRDEPEDA